MEELDLYLNLVKGCMEAVPKMSLWKFNNEQCEYLGDKLKVVIESASLLLEVFKAEDHELCSLVDIAKEVKTFKFLLSLTKQIESFIKGCSKDAWVETAMTLTNASEYVSSLGFNLELCKVAFCKELGEIKCFTQDEIDDISKTEARIVKKKATVDVKNLIKNITSILNCLNGKNRDLASYLLHRLLRFEPNSTSNMESLWESVLQQMKALFTLVMPTQQLGRGASATVYKAMWLETSVAKKSFIGPENPEFLKEVEILSQLCHPNITSMFCCAKNKRSCSIIMELMDGDLKRLMDARCGEDSDFQPFPILQAIDIMHQIAEGVNYLHNKQIVHRDLKSTNILVKCENAMEESKIEYVHVKVTDFGLSKTKEKSITYSNLTYNMGTNRWMAPEVIYLNEDNQNNSSGSHEKLSYPFKCDIYSFGMVCYEILTGWVPFSSIVNTNDIKKRVMKGERPILPEDCPSKLKALIEKCWNQEPKNRPTFAEICSELKYLKYLLMRGYTLIKEEVEERLSASRWELARKFTIHSYPLIQEEVEELLSASKWELAHTFTMHSNYLYGIAINPSGNLVATASSDKLCRIYDVRLQKQVAMLAGHLRGLWAVKFSPTQQNLVGTVSDDKTCRLWSKDIGKCLRILKGHTNAVLGLSFKPGTNLLATVSRDASSMIWDAEMGRSVTTLMGHQSDVYGVCFKPNGDHLVATTSSDYTAKLWDPRSAENVQTLTGHSRIVFGVDIDESGMYLATGSWDKTCRVWDLRCMGHNPIVVLQAHSGVVNEVAFSPYGKLLATTSDDKTVRLFNTTTWECIQILSLHSDWVYDVAWPPAGDFLVTASFDRSWKLFNPRVRDLSSAVPNFSSGAPSKE